MPHASSGASAMTWPVFGAKAREYFSFSKIDPSGLAM
jgi:hypothetical protein